MVNLWKMGSMVGLFDDESFAPLSVREGKREPFELTSGVPDYLLASIASWAGGWFRDPFAGLSHDKLLQACRCLRINASGDSDQLLDRIGKMSMADDEFILDLVDLLLHLGHDATCLDGYLREVNHEYRVADDWRHLTRRVDSTAQEAYRRAATPADHASALLSQAWEKAYSRHEEPAGAWDDACAAVEALLKPVVSPKDEKATLGKMKAALRNAPHKWDCTLSDLEDKTGVQRFLAALDVITYRPDRHPTGEGVEIVSIEESRMVVLQVVTVVNWLRDDALHPVVGDV